MEEQFKNLNLMTVTKRKSLKSPVMEMLDDGILVRDAMTLVVGSEYYDQINDAFNVDEIKEDFIHIRGAGELVRSIIEADEEFEKIDVDASLSNVRLDKYTDDKQIVLEISGIEDDAILKRTKTDLIRAESRYAVRAEYLNMFGADKYLEFCRTHSYQDIIDANIEMLNAKASLENKSKKFRLLRDKDNNYYARAITSTGVYRDYNLRFSLFIALIELHRLSKHRGLSFYIGGYSLSESNLEVIFKTTKTNQVSNDTKIGFALELVNDEIKRDAVKFNGVFTVFIGKTEVFVKPEEIKACILSFPHSIGVEKLKERMSNLNMVINNFIDDTIETAKKIKILSAPDLLREYLLMKIRYSKNTEFNKLYRTQILSILSNKVRTVFELAAIFDKVELLIEDEHISSLDFWRYKLYQVLLDETKK
jgi:hypothetical protein